MLIGRLIVTVSCEFRGAVAAHRAAVTRDSSEAADRKLVCVAHCNTADTRHSHSLHHHDAMTSCLGSSLQMLMSIFLMFPPPPVPLHTSTTTTLSVATAPQHHSTTAHCGLVPTLSIISNFSPAPSNIEMEDDIYCPN